MNHAALLSNASYRLSQKQLKQLNPLGLLSNAYLHVLLTTSHYLNFKQGDTIRASEVSNSIAYITSGKVVTVGGEDIVGIEQGNYDALFMDNAENKVYVRQDTLLICFDKTLYKIFEKEHELRQRFDVI